VSAIAGLPLKLEKRAVTGDAGPCRWGACESSLAPRLGVKLPSTTMPLAWMARLCFCGPKTLLMASTMRATSTWLSPVSVIMELDVVRADRLAMR